MNFLQIFTMVLNFRQSHRVAKQTLGVNRILHFSLCSVTVFPLNVSTANQIFFRGFGPLIVCIIGLRISLMLNSWSHHYLFLDIIQLRVLLDLFQRNARNYWASWSFLDLCLFWNVLISVVGGIVLLILWFQDWALWQSVSDNSCRDQLLLFVDRFPLLYRAFSTDRFQIFWLASLNT